MQPVQPQEMQPDEAATQAVPDGATAAMEPEAVLWQHFGLPGTASPLADAPGSFEVSGSELFYRLDVTDDPTRRDRFVRQGQILQALAEETGLQVLRPVRDRTDALVADLGRDEEDGDEGENGDDEDGAERPAEQQAAGPFARLLALPETGLTAAGRSASPANAAKLGRFVAELTRAIAAADAGRDATSLTSPLDLRQAGPLVVRLLRSVNDPEVRNPVAKCMVTALRQIQPLGPDLRRQLVHHAPTRTELLVETLEDEAGPRDWQPVGFLSVEALGDGWLIAPLAALLADLMAAAASDPFAGLPALSAFHAALPLTEPELKALWPLTTIRIALLRAEAEQKAVAAPDDEERLAARLAARALFHAATEVHPAFMEAAILEAAGWPQEPAPTLGPMLPQIDPDDIRLADLSATSPLFSEGNWEDPDIDWRLLARVAFENRMGATRFGEYRLSRAGAAGGGETENLALHVDLCVPAGTAVAAPMGGVLHLSDRGLVLAGKGASLQLEGLDCPLHEATALFAGDPLGVVAGAEGSVGGLRIRLSRVADLMPPLFAPHRLAPVWRRLALSPSLVLGRDLDAPAIDATPLARGWRDRVYDGHGRAFVDLSGAAGLIGHGHPDMAEAAYRQWLTLGGLQGTGADSEFRGALLALLPEAYATIVTLTDEEQAMVVAVDLAERLSPDPDAPLSISDERRSGFGRLGSRFWGFGGEEDLPDIIVTGSPVPGAPLAAVILHQRHAADAADPALDAADAVACRIGSAVLATLGDGRHVAPDTAEAARQLESAMRRLAGTAPQVLEVEGEGLALDLVLGPEAPSAFDLARQLAQHGILVSRPQSADRLSLTAPLCLGREGAEQLVTALRNLLHLPAANGGATAQS
ncbi:hypothetical protein [Rhizobium sp. CSW-27]|uniref:hypothetical protein n=1 Tax=Rhizobium sp. CSW-27 TaxID=2839985 RepID=UPI001C0377F8|nr:hypothetical protein [Rhizobium sp. CSW-27]MBT9372745.1 hypothetical protein [Rhizobium sp. CSW-27]